MIKKLTSIDYSRNRKRFYIIDDMQYGLFDGHILNIQWGRIGHRSRKRSYYFKTKFELERMLKKILKRRKRHNYKEVTKINL